MIYNPSLERQQAAFRLLADLAQRWYAEGRRAYGAGLKPEMRALTGNAFDENELGFATFKQFLMAAADQDFVDVYPAPNNSHDVYVVPKGKTPSETIEARPSARSATEPRVRADIWKAFVDWNKAFARFYDRTSDTAHLVATTESVLDSPEIKVLREQQRMEPDRFVPITPISLEEQVGWMREFAARQQPEDQLHLMLATESSRPARDFSVAVRRSPTLASAWRRERIKRVLEVIEPWKAEHNVAVDIYSPPATTSIPAARPSDDLTIDEKRLRERVHVAIDAMSVAELLDLPIRLHYIIDVERSI
jgi:hypothetical protein